MKVIRVLAKNFYLFYRLNLLAFLFYPLFFWQNSLASNSRNLTVFAEPTMSLPLTKIARIFSQKNNVIVSINFSSAFDLINEIDQGAPANVFVTAHPQIIGTLRQKGLVDVYNIAYIANDFLALCTSKKNKLFPVDLLKKNISFEDSLRVLNKNKSNLILDHEGVASGVFSKEIIQNLFLSDIKIFNKLPEDKASIIRDIENEKDVYGVVFLSQLRRNNNLRTLNVKKDENIFYQAYVIAGEQMDVAREFLNFLKNPVSKKILEESGFNTEN